jgi:hypothetical protein
MQKQSWQLEGLPVKGKYLDLFPYTGVVTLSRVKYGGHVQHTVKLDAPITVYGSVRDYILADESDDFSVVVDYDDIAGLI